MQITTVPNDFIINAATETGGRIVSNFLLHGLRIKNNSDKTITVNSINYELYSEELFIKQVTYQGKSLENNIRDFIDKSNWLSVGFGAKLFLGREGFWHLDCRSHSPEIKPNQEIGAFNEYFVIVHDKLIDTLVIKVNYDENEFNKIEELKIPLIQYKNKNQYIFPLKGCLSTCGNYNSLVEHRQHYSMEFAFDMAQYNSEQKLCYKENMTEEDYIVFGKDILAIADGEVVDCYHSFTVTTSWDWNERKPYIDKYGLPAQCGNYIVLKHAGGEYSFYGHLATNSLTIKKGDKVAQGQVIGKVGHTGMSSCPHLHFQLMDGPDFFYAKGLPCHFTNIKDVCGNKLNFIQEDNIIVHAE
jgi:hypothetical protein